MMGTKKVKSVYKYNALNLKQCVINSMQNCLIKPKVYNLLLYIILIS